MIDVSEKLQKKYPVKLANVSLKIEDVDEANRTVKGYFSAFDVMDADNDVIRKGAFKKSIQERGPKSSGNRKIAHLFGHDWNKLIGRLTELKEDEAGLYFVSEMGRSTQGDDALKNYQDGIIREHSIGFNYLSSGLKFIDAETSEFDNERGHWEVTEVSLWEGSAVAFGANEFTPVIEAAKTAEDRQGVIDELKERSEVLERVIRKGTGTDERLYNIEMMFKQIQELTNSLIEAGPVDIKTTQQDEQAESSVKEQAETAKKQAILDQINLTL